MHLKVWFLMTMLYVSLLWSFIADFFHDAGWTSTTVKYGPMALTWLFIFVLAIFEALNKKEHNESDSDKSETTGNFMKLCALLFMWFIVAAMNFLVGEPKMDLLNIYSPEFWIFLIMIPSLALFHYKKKTDGVS